MKRAAAYEDRPKSGEVSATEENLPVVPVEGEHRPAPLPPRLSSCVVPAHRGGRLDGGQRILPAVRAGEVDGPREHRVQGRVIMMVLEIRDGHSSHDHYLYHQQTPMFQHNDAPLDGRPGGVYLSDTLPEAVFDQC